MTPEMAIETIALLSTAFIAGAVFDETKIGYGFQTTKSQRDGVNFSIELAFDSAVVRRNDPALSTLSVLVDFHEGDIAIYRATSDLLLEFRKTPSWRRQTIIMAARSKDRCRIYFEIKRDNKDALVAELAQLNEFIGVPA